MTKFKSIKSLTLELNNFNIKNSSQRPCLPFMIDDKPVGFIRRNIWKYLQPYNEVLILKQWNEKEIVTLNPSLTSNESRTSALDVVLRSLRSKGLLKTLKGWRDEMYDVWYHLSEPPLMEMERSATCLFGVVQCGVHINGYTDHPEHGLSMWIAKRSQTKPTWPGRLDQMAAGGLPAGMDKLEAARNECKEEASVPDHLLDRLKFTGTISYIYEDERGVFPEIQYVLDLLLPADFTPVNADGEAESFQLVPITQIKELVLDENFKPNCALCAVDFLVRHGYITPDTEPDYFEIISGMHSNLRIFDDYFKS